jgi:hypothetical protein
MKTERARCQENLGGKSTKNGTQAIINIRVFPLSTGVDKHVGNFPAYLALNRPEMNRFSKVFSAMRRLERLPGS